MEAIIDRLLRAFESGAVSRRDVIAGLSALVVAEQTAGSAEAATSPFQAVGTNHIALRVTDVARSRDFYSRLLGIQPVREGRNQCFLDMQSGFLALFRNDVPGMDHYCIAVQDFDVERAQTLLEKEGLEPRQPRGSDRIYFRDPDGLEVQLASVDHDP